jgi:hypothetical protein
MSKILRCIHWADDALMPWAQEPRVDAEDEEAEGEQAAVSSA